MNAPREVACAADIDFELTYAEASRRESVASADCVDLYFASAVAAHARIANLAGSPREPGRNRAWLVYHSSVAKLIETGQRYGRLDPTGVLVVFHQGGRLEVPINYGGFPWPADTFGHFLLVGDYHTPQLSERLGSAGAGVPLVVVSQRPECASPASLFVFESAPFAATALLRVDCAETGAAIGGGVTLDFLDPLRVSSVDFAGREMPLAADLSAPLAAVSMTPDRSYLRAFLEPGRTEDEAGLCFLEPYQPGKIPLVLVHGLASGPTTWLEMINQLRAVPRIVERYQFWLFRYSSGESFLRSAALLRRQLSEAVLACDPNQRDPALAQMVMIGHSMGGLITKLQITASGQSLWDTVSRVPLDMLCTTPATRERLRDMFFFEPHPGVRVAIFVATPHGGSALAARGVGRLASLMVREPPERREQHEQLKRDNPGAMAPFIARRIPTSVDMLEPSNPLLQAIRRLPISACASMHSIIGVGHWSIFEGESDGVVPVDSALQAGVATQLFVKSRHEDVHRQPESVDEVVAILARHACAVSVDEPTWPEPPAETVSPLSPTLPNANAPLANRL